MILALGFVSAALFGGLLTLLGVRWWNRRSRSTWQRAPGVLDLVRSRGDRLELDALDAANRGRGWGRP